MRTTGQVTWINFYGRKNQGAVCGTAFAFMVVASGIGPLPLAWSDELAGGYQAALWAFLSLPLISGLCVWNARKPVKHYTAIGYPIDRRG